MYTVVRDSDSRFCTVQVQSAVAPIEDWDSTNLFPDGMRIVAIEMAPGAVGDAVAINDEGNVVGGRIFTHIAIANYDIAVRYYGGHEKFGYRGVLCHPVILSANNVGNFTVTFELA